MVDHLLHPEHGVLERVREALAAAGEQVTDLDVEAYGLADRFAFASEFVGATQGELIGAEDSLSRVGSSLREQPEVLPRRDDSAKAQAALPSSPAAEKAKTSPALGTPSPQTGSAVAAPHPPPASRQSCSR